MYKKNMHFHCIGIGGIGMSAIALILKKQNYTVSGCDCNIQQKSIKKLLNAGCLIFDGHGSPGCYDNSIDVIIYSSAIKPNNPDIIQARKQLIPIISRAQMLAELMRTKTSIAIAGSHGKTTTSSMIAHILLENKKDPTIIIGGFLQNINSNAHQGSGDYIVAEADESDRSFLLLPHSINVITNISLEHLDTYSNLEDIVNTFKQFLKNLPFYGKSIICLDDTNNKELIKALPEYRTKIITYGFDPRANFHLSHPLLEPDRSSATLSHNGTIVGTFTITMPGIHNLLNAAAAIAVADQCALSFEQAKNALSTFSGVEQRFTYKGTYNNTEIFDDYGHHPKEIANTLIVARKRSKNRLIVLFQPHRFTRTKALWHDFIEIFSNFSFDHLIITDIFAASEDPIPHITSKRLVEELNQRCPTKKIIYLPSSNNFSIIRDQFNTLIQPNDLALFLGAGKINSIVDDLL